MDTGSIGLKVLEILSPVLLAALTWASAKLAQLIRAKAQNEYLKGVLVRLDDAVFTAVKDLQQTVVAAIKEASADGRITDDEKRQIKDKALAAVKSHLGTKGIAELAGILGLEGGALDGLLSSKIEAAVHDLRRAEAQPASAPPNGAAVPLAPAPAA
jgi:uncharacterized protein YidB (DUF937 family)